MYVLQQEMLRLKELQAQQLEEQRAQFKMRTQNLLQFREQSPEPKTKASRKKVVLKYSTIPRSR